MSLPPLMEAMSRSNFYPGCSSPVEVRQTHISYVFLAGAFVYKVKKPVRFTFLDYSTLAKRRRFCIEEVRLNRRLAPSVYLGALPIIKRRGEFSLAGETEVAAPSGVVEYAVKMRRLPEERMLDALVRNGKADVEEIDEVTRKLVAFHSHASSERAAIYGNPEEIWRRLTDNFCETKRFVERTIPERRSTSIEEYSRGFMEDSRELFERRAQEGKVRDGHGDLRAEHICLADDISVFDCIEFDERLRYCDVASEIGFLSMDLDFLGAPSLSRRLLATYASMADDREIPALLPFYQCYRAYVRGKVESLKSEEPEVPQQEREQARGLAGRYFRLSHRYARGSPRPAMLVVCGMVGSGKSTMARSLQDLTGFDRFNSDIVRKRLAGLPATARAASGYRTGLYSNALTRRTYSVLWAETERSLKEGRGVIADATFKDAGHRRLFLQGAEALHVPVLFVECRAREEEILRRLGERESRTEEVSDATRGVYISQRVEFAPLDEIPDRCRITIDTEAELDGELKKVEDWLYA